MDVLEDDVERFSGFYKAMVFDDVRVIEVLQEIDLELQRH